MNLKGVKLTTSLLVGFHLFFVFFLTGSFFLKPAVAQDTVRLLLTSNIEGKSIPEIKNQDTEDPLLVLAQNILTEKRQGVDLYLDLGNGFYPGVISKYSSGSIMMDFFDYFGCMATLISSKDLQIGLQNLEFLQKSRNVHLLSANIRRADKPAFTPFFIKKINEVPIAFVGLSSTRVEFDIAEKDLFDTELMDEKEALESTLQEISASGIEHIVLVSGLKIISTLKLLEDYPQIDLALCGGDYTGKLFQSKTLRIDLADGRSIVMLDQNYDYYTIDLSLGDTIYLQTVNSKKASPKKVFEEDYLTFRNRMNLWKEKYSKEQSQQVAKIDQEYLINDERLLQLMRDRFNCELSIVDQDTINPYPISGDISQSDLLYLVNLDFKIFTFNLTGDQVSKVISEADDAELVIAGITQNGKNYIQGYPIKSNRLYNVAATQSVLKKMRHAWGSNLELNNTWITVTDILTEDLKNEKILLKDDYSYLEKRYRTLIDVSLSNFITSGHVERGENIETPSDQPKKSYTKWGLEDLVDLTIYNNSHMLVFSPYIHYARQDKDYLYNLLQGTLLYEYNLSDKFRPYNKFQCNSAVDDVDNERPVLIRETAGGSLYGNHLTGKIGIGFEKKVQDPQDDALFGFETIIDFEYPFLKYFTYTFNLDNFISSAQPEDGQWGLRCEIDNKISVSLNSFLSFSLRHKYFYLYEIEVGEDQTNEDYRSSQIYTTLDLKSDWKFW